MMDVILVSSYQPGSVTRIDIAPPLSILLLMGALEQAGYRSRMIDLNLYKPSSCEDEEAFYTKIIASEIKSKQTLVGFSCLTTGHFPFFKKAASYLKLNFPTIRVAIGGCHSSLFGSDILYHCPEIDYVGIGESEEQIVELVSTLDKNWNSSDFDIQAFGWRDTAGNIQLREREIFNKDLDTIYHPSWHSVNFEKYYRDHSQWHNPKQHDIKVSIPIQTSRSCPFSCSFCSSIEVNGRGYRRRSANAVVDEIQLHVEQFGHRYFGFVDDNLTVSKRHILAIMNEIVRRDLDIQFESFSGYHIATLDEEVITALVEAGCIYTLMPIEHGNERMRNQIIGKKLPTEKIYEVVENYRKFEVLIRAVFIMGFPEDTHDTLRDTLEMIQRLQVDLVDVFTLIPYPGTKVFEQAMRDDLFINKIDQKELWSGHYTLNNQSSTFYLKPYSLSLNDLGQWRKTFDTLSEDHLNNWKATKNSRLNKIRSALS
ncbi:B12-binding domain-containing radical SAM protein [Allochromatium vinosum]|uniref:Radical SAM domain protein n=1 Tax=Allochromatium vinosum (strain ATCC 17899 / DSM 180 / NBRC 103801 / NCIMB 10441 / D) TaxID=572477 RepID=D3RUK8_ALLVD|nr:radical SAM protein [Allochromatium vinosum]ADC62867.1 Radical SAM domain protein [Allochromatium vinosum DSM 180]